MHAPLKRQLVIGPHPSESWNGRVDGLEIHKEERVFQSTQFLADFGAEPRLPRLHAGSSTPLPLVQWEVVGDVANGFDAHLLQFLHRACLDSGYIADVVIW